MATSKPLMRPTRLLLALAITAGLLVAGGPQALACSCATGDPRARLVEAPAAFVGTLESIGPQRPDGNHAYRFKIEKAVKGKFEATQVVLGSVGDGASCGLEVQVGQRTGLFLQRSGQGWTAFLCSQVEADLLLAAGLPMPKPDGVRPVALVASVEWGDVRALALDSAGRTIAYGLGGPALMSIDVCPGGRLAAGWGRGVVVVREIATMKIVSQWPATAKLPEGASDFSEIACRDEAAREVLLFGTTGYPVPTGEIAVARDRTIVRRFRGAWKDASFTSGKAYTSGGAAGHTIESVDLSSGKVAPITTLARFGEPEEVGRPVLGPDGRLLAVAVTVYAGSKGATPSRVVLIDTATAKVSSAPMPEVVDGRPAWFAADGFVVASTDGSAVFNTKLERLGSFRGWQASRPLVVGSVGYGMTYGALHAVRLPGGPVHQLRTFGTTQTLAIAVVPGAQAPRDLGPVLTPPPEEEGVPEASAPTSKTNPASRWLPILVFALLFVGTPVTVFLVRRRSRLPVDLPEE